MGKFKANKLLSEFTLPGTHDAAMSGDVSPSIGKGLARCQSSTLAEQACEGARVFDLRVKKATWEGENVGTFEFLHPGWVGVPDGWSVSTKENPGRDLATALAALVGYLATHATSELLILRFKGEAFDAPQSAEFALRMEHLFGEFAVRHDPNLGSNIAKYRMDQLVSPRSKKRQKSARVAMMHYKWTPEFPDLPASDPRRSMWWPYSEENVAGKFSKSPKLSEVLNTQWAQLTQYVKDGGTKQGTRLFSFYITITDSSPHWNGLPSVYENTKAEYEAGTELETIREKALKDYPKLRLGHIVMMDFIGDPLWNNQKFLTQRKEPRIDPVVDLCIQFSDRDDEIV